jgi:hypothetical protein
MRLSIPKSFKSAAAFGDWTLYHLPLSEGAGSFLWQPFKLMLTPGSAPAKRGGRRAYRLTWSPLEQRFAKSKETEHLSRAQPVLFDMIEFHLTTEYGPDWLTERALYDPEEVEAESARLKARRSARAAQARAAGRG